MRAGLTESNVERIAIDLFAELGYEYVSGPAIAPQMPGEERASYGECILKRRLLSALVRLNRGIPAEAIEEAARRLGRTVSPSLVAQNHETHRLLLNGVDLSWRE